MKQRSRRNKIFWYSYLIFISATCLLVAGDYLKIFPSLTPIDWIHLIALPLYPISVIAFLGKNKLFSRKVWQFVFWFFVADGIFSILYLIRDLLGDNLLNDIIGVVYRTNLPSVDWSYGVGILIFTLIIMLPIFLFLIIPGYYANYKLAYPKGIRGKN